VKLKEITVSYGNRRLAAWKTSDSSCAGVFEFAENARDAMRDGGTVIVRAERVALETGAPVVIIEFSDTRTGSKAEVLPNFGSPS
jgi:glycerol-3-phosphate dehydrogenase